MTPLRIKALILTIIVICILIYTYWVDKDLCPKCAYIHCLRRTSERKTKCSAYINNRGKR